MVRTSRNRRGALKNALFGSCCVAVSVLILLCGSSIQFACANEDDDDIRVEGEEIEDEGDDFEQYYEDAVEDPLFDEGAEVYVKGSLAQAFDSSKCSVMHTLRVNFEAILFEYVGTMQSYRLGNRSPYYVA